MRKLAHIEKILNLEPIDGKDRILKAKVLGFDLLVGKDDFKLGDLVLYVECDSILPPKPEFEFLRQRCWSELYQGFRIKTLKFNKTLISTGIAFPVSILPEGKYKEGQDLTEQLSIRHYDPESPLNSIDTELSKKSFKNKVFKILFRFAIFRKILLPFIRNEKGNWPEFLSKTDEYNIKSEPYVLEKFKDKICYVGEKLEGQSGSVFFKKTKVNLLKNSLFGVCSRNIWLKTEDNSNHWKLVRKYNLKEVLANYYKKTGKEICLQFECLGGNIQGNIYKLTDLELRVFNVIDITNNYYFDVHEMISFCKENGLETVPILDANFKLPATVDELVKYASGFSALKADELREGIVLRCIENGQKLLSCKAFNNEYLLKHGR